jgi:hypothetical protein
MRALEGLQRRGQIIGFRTSDARAPKNRDWRVELCHHWMTERQAQKWVEEHPRLPHTERVVRKMQAIGMKPSQSNERRSKPPQARSSKSLDNFTR